MKSQKNIHNQIDYTFWKKTFSAKLMADQNNFHDPSHDLLHFQRVSKTASQLSSKENADEVVVFAAAWLHDFINLPKNHPDRKQASKLSAQGAIKYLKEINYPTQKFDEIAHAIEAHSFSAQVTAQTLEAQIVQDADRLDALGAIGVARCFTVSAQFKASFYDPEDPFHEARPLDDSKYTIDHFFQKLFKLPELINTESAKQEAVRRINFMQHYLSQLAQEIS